MIRQIMQRFGFSDLVTCFAILAFLAVPVVSSIDTAQQLQSRIMCGNNLRQIGQALYRYQLDYDSFPSGPADPEAAPSLLPPVAFSSQSTANDTSRPLFLLMTSAGLEPSVLICPAALGDGLVDKPTASSAEALWNFPSRLTLSFSLFTPYTSASVSKFSAPRIGSRTTPPNLPLAADINPGGPDIHTVSLNTELRFAIKANSPNHRREDQNVLYADASVASAHTPFAGIDRDNIYSAQSSSASSQIASATLPAQSSTYPFPAHANDAVLLPTWDAGPQLVARQTTLRQSVFYTLAIFGLIALPALVITNKLRNRRLSPAHHSLS